MTAPVLVTFATRYGSTQEVAEVIAAALREFPLEVTLRPMKQLNGLEGYRAVVMGAPLYAGRLHEDARRFLAQHRAALSALPVAVFALGPLSGPGAEEEWQGARAALAQELAKVPWLEPVALKLFGGKYDPTGLRFPDSLIAGLPASPLKQLTASDTRDWAAIRTWASELAARLRPAVA